MVKNDGKVVDFNTITDHAQASREFAEGSAPLEKLLLECFKRGIVTNACCAGHEGSRPIIVFKDTPETRPYVLRAVEKLFRNGYEIRFNNLSGEEFARWVFSDNKAGERQLSTEQVWDGLEGKVVHLETRLFGELLDVFRGDTGNAMSDVCRAFVDACDKIKKHGAGYQCTSDYHWDGAHFYNIQVTGPSSGDGHALNTLTNAHYIRAKHDDQFVRHIGRINVANLIDA